MRYGNPETTTGGRALKFYSSVRIEVRKGEAIKDGPNVIGARTKIKIVKNKVAPPFKTCEVDMLFGEGISKEGSLLDRAVAFDIIHKSGAWFSYRDEKIGQGRDNVRKYIKSHPEFMQEIDKQVRARIQREFSGSGPENPEDIVNVMPAGINLPFPINEISDNDILESIGDIDLNL